MSKKNLARTVIEGGRYTGNKWDRRNSHAEFRARDKNYIKEVTADPENWYDYDSEPTEPVYKGFRDKLGPMFRWLHSQVGRPWDEVRSEVTETFDTRTTAGRHIVYDHLLSNVEVTPDLHYGRYYRGPDDYTTSYYKNDFYVDETGLLQRKRYITRKKKVPYFNTNQIANWLSGRIVGYAGKRLFWFVPVDKTKKWGGRARQWKTQWGYLSHPYSYYYNGPTFLYLHNEPIFKKDSDGNFILDERGCKIVTDFHTTWRSGTPQFRQDRRLNDKELAFWNTIPQDYQTKVLEQSPTYEAPEKPPSPYPYY